MLKLFLALFMAKKTLEEINEREKKGESINVKIIFDTRNS